MKKKFTMFRPKIRSRHPSHSPLRTLLPLLPFRSIVRLGSTTDFVDRFDRVECNSIESIKNSADKLKMKQKFTEAGVKTADWWTIDVGNIAIKNGEGEQGCSFNDLPYPIVAKHRFGSRGTGNYKLDSKEQLETWMQNKTLSNYIFEKFYTYSKEYRIHVTNEGCFYTCRKLIKDTAPEGIWQRHDDGNIVWILENNESFKKPNNWDLIVEDCIKAKNALGLDICSFDVMTQGSSKENPKWIIIESQSAPSFGEITLQKYLLEIPKILKIKYESLSN